jgi:hypothetical protein
MTPADFWSRVAVAGPDDCWEWQGFRNETGYGRISNSRRRDGWPRSIRAHRMAYALHNGERPGEHHVLHSCDNPACCNPAHLRLGTPADNGKDKAERGRANPPRGSQHTHARLTEEQVREIRARFRPGKYGDSSRAAREFGVNKTTIAGILRGEQWRHVQ